MSMMINFIHRPEYSYGVWPAALHALAARHYLVSHEVATPAELPVMVGRLPGAVLVGQNADHLPTNLRSRCICLGHMNPVSVFWKTFGLKITAAGGSDMLLVKNIQTRIQSHFVDPIESVAGSVYAGGSLGVVGQNSDTPDSVTVGSAWLSLLFLGAGVREMCGVSTLSNANAMVKMFESMINIVRVRVVEDMSAIMDNALAPTRSLRIFHNPITLRRAHVLVGSGFRGFIVVRFPDSDSGNSTSAVLAIGEVAQVVMAGQVSPLTYHPGFLGLRADGSQMIFRTYQDAQVFGHIASAVLEQNELQTALAREEHLAIARGQLEYASRQIDGVSNLRLEPVGPTEE